MSINLKIKVTKDILEKSKNCSEMAAQNCAVALAIRDIFPYAWVGLSGISTKLGYAENVSILLPPGVDSFISKFDLLSPQERVLMPEIEFEITIPDEAIDFIKIDEIRPLLINHPTLELIEH